MTNQALISLAKEYLGVDVPNEAEYVSLYSEQEVRGNVFYVDSIVEDNIMSIGNLNCDISEDGIVMEMNNPWT